MKKLSTCSADSESGDTRHACLHQCPLEGSVWADGLCDDLVMKLRVIVRRLSFGICIVGHLGWVSEFY